MLSGSEDKAVIVWDFASLSQVCKLRQHKKPVFACLFIGNNGHVASAASDQILLWDLETCLVVKCIEINRVEFLKVIQFGSSFVFACTDYSVKFWDLEFGNVEGFYAHLDYVSFLKVVSDKVLVTGGKDGTARVWNLKDRKQVACFWGC